MRYRYSSADYPENLRLSGGNHSDKIEGDVDKKISIITHVCLIWVIIISLIPIIITIVVGLELIVNSLPIKICIEIRVTRLQSSTTWHNFRRNIW